MNQADISKLMSQLKCRVNPRLRKFRTIKGPEYRLVMLRKTVTALIKHERLELNFPRAEESRMYAERVSFYISPLPQLFYDALFVSLETN